MARHRVNKRLLMMLVGGLILLTGFMWGVWQGRMRQRDPQPFMVKGDELIAQEDYLNAVLQYRRASGWAARKGDTNTQVDALIKISQAMPHVDTEHAVAQAVGALEQAVTKDPSSVKVRRARLELLYERTQDRRLPGWVPAWRELQQYSDDLIEAISRSGQEGLDEDSARAHYLRGWAMLVLTEIQTDLPPLEILKTKRDALVFFAKARTYDPDSVEYGKALMRTYLHVAEQLLLAYKPLSKKQRELVVEYWHEAQKVAQNLSERQPNSGAALILLSAPLHQAQVWSKADLLDRVAEDPQVGSGLDDLALVEAYLQAWADDSPRPTLSEVNSAIDRLIEDYIQKSEKLGTGVVAVQMTKASYWQDPSRNDLNKVRVALQQAAEAETEMIIKLRLYFNIAQAYYRDGQKRKAVEICEQALAIPVDMRIIRIVALRSRLYMLQEFAAQSLVELGTEILRNSEGSDTEEVDALLDQAEEHLKAGLEIIEAGDKVNSKTLTRRGQIAQLRRPQTRQNNRQAIIFYEQARDQMENLRVEELSKRVRDYGYLLVRLAEAYNFDGQSGAAEEALSKAIDTLQKMLSGSETFVPIEPSHMLILADLQLKNRHISVAEKTLDDLANQLRQDPEKTRPRWTGELLKRRARQFELQGNVQEALSTAQQVEAQHPALAKWSLTYQFTLLRDNPDSNGLETEAVLIRWMALEPDSSTPVRLLIESYLKLEQGDKAQALKAKALAENPEWEQDFSQIIVLDKDIDREERQQILKEQILKGSDEPLQQLLRLFSLYHQDYTYYSNLAAKQSQEGETELAEESHKQSIRNRELSVQTLEKAYEIQANDPRVYQNLLSYYLVDRDWAKAEKVVARSAEENWDGMDGLFARGRLHMAKGESLAETDAQASKMEYEESLKYLEQAVRMREKFSQGWTAKARVEHHLGQEEAALESARIAVEQNPTSILSVRLLLQLTATQWERAVSKGSPTEARQFADETYALAQRAQELDPNDRQAALFMLAYLDEYNSGRAINLRLALLKKNPNDRDNLQRLLRIYQREKKTAELRAVLADLVVQQPDSLELVLLLAEYYNRDKQYAEAVHLLEPALPRWPDNLSVALTLVRTYHLNNEPQKAKACLQEFLSTVEEEEKARVYQNLGILEIESGRQKEAVEAFSLAIANVQQYHPEDIKRICDLSWLMFNNGARRTAIATILPLAEKNELYAIRVLVDLYLREFNPEESIKWSRRAVSLSPESLDEKLVLATALLAGNKPVEVQELLKEEAKDIASSDKAVSLYIILSKAHSIQRQYEEARLLLEQAINSGIAAPKIQLELATLYRFQGKIDQATKLCQLVLEKQPSNRVARQILANLWMGQGRYSQANVLLEEGREIDANESLWPGQLSKLWLNRKDKASEERGDKALSYALEAATKSGNTPPSVAEVMSILNLQNKYNRCVNFYESTVPEAYKQNHRILMQLARAKRGQWEQGKSSSTTTMSVQELEQLKRTTKALYFQALDNARGDWSTYRTVTQELAVMLGLDEAIQSSETLADKNPKDTHNRILLAMLLSVRAQQWQTENQEAQANADMSRAVSILQSLVQQPNFSATARLTVERQLAEVYGNLGMYTEAVDMYTKVLQVLPNDIVTLNNLSYLLADTLGKPEEALGYIERALHQIPQDPDLLDTYGWALLKAGQIEKALEKMQQSVSIKPFGTNYYHLGVVYKEAKENRRALQALREAEKFLEQDAGYTKQTKAKVRALIEELEQE